jgi:hypothetical protein
VFFYLINKRNGLVINKRKILFFFNYNEIKNVKQVKKDFKIIQAPTECLPSRVQNFVDLPILDSGPSRS